MNEPTPLDLHRPIVFFDIEATGLDLVQDRIVSLALVKLWPGGSRTQQEFLFDPGFPMSAEVIAIHGITNQMVQGQPRFADRAERIARDIEGCDLGGFNLLNYDLPLLDQEMMRARVPLNLAGVRVIDCGNIFKKKETRTLTAAVKLYCGRELEGAHNASNDTLATIDVLFGQLQKYPDLRVSVEALAEFSKMDQRIDLAGKLVRDADGHARYNFGKAKGVKLSDDPGFGEWMLRQPFLTRNTVECTRRELRKIYDAEEAENQLS
jgi:DNA polymerase-3 subunit epsilon